MIRKADIKAVEHLGGGDSASAGRPDGPLAPEDVPAGAIPEIGAFSGNAFLLISDSATRESTTLTYKGEISVELLRKYIALVEEKYGFRVVDQNETNRWFFNQMSYALLYEGEAEVENFVYDRSEVSLVVDYWTIGSSGNLEITYARGLQAVDAGDRGVME